jgi:ribA/ribD-fused uncharacterized protein
LVQDRLYIDDVKYEVKTLNKLPEPLKPKNIATRETDTEIFFWGKHAPMSNFYSENSKFTVENTEYMCVEQFYSAEKARFFNDKRAEEIIMATTNPAIHKRTKIVGYKNDLWNAVSREKMKIGITAKFTQNTHLKTILKSSIGKTLVEANPNDDHWGIGLAISDPRIGVKENWGRNVLGSILMEVRETLK